MKQILSALEFMHGRGIMHRDLKPANILLNRDCTTKISDLGAALGSVNNNSKRNLFARVRNSDPLVRSPELYKAHAIFFQVTFGLRAVSMPK